MEIQEPGREADVESQRISRAIRDATFAAELERLRNALVGLPLDAATKRFRAPLLVLARAARQQEIPPERLIAELKAVLFRLPHFDARRAVERGEMMHQLVTIAINAYYDRTDD
jgi:hypothetical protein